MKKNNALLILFMGTFVAIGIAAGLFMTQPPSTTVEACAPTPYVPCQPGNTKTIYGDWSGWNENLSTCTKSRSRSVTVVDKNDGTVCSVSSQTDTKKIPGCKVPTPTTPTPTEPTVTATTPVPPTDTATPTKDPTEEPTDEPSETPSPSVSPSPSETSTSTVTPPVDPTEEPTAEPTEPTAEPSKTPPVVLPVAPRCNFVFADLSEEQKAECDRSSGGIYIPDVLPKPGDEFAVDVSGSQNDCAHYWELTRSADGTYHRGTYTWVKDRWEPPKGYETGLWRTQFFGKPVTAMWSVQDPISLVWTEMWHEAVPFGDIYMIDNIPRERIIFVFDGLWGNGPFSWDEVAEKKIQPAGNYEPFTRFYGSSNRWSINPDLK